MNGMKERNRDIALIMEKTSEQEKAVLLAWLEEIIEIRNAPIGKIEKIRRILLSARHSAKLLPVLRKIKPLLWDNRSKAFRAGLGLTAATALLIPGNAGIATATIGIGVPIWVLSATGYAAVLGLASELRRHRESFKKGDIIDADYTVIEEAPKKNSR